MSQPTLVGLSALAGVLLSLGLYHFAVAAPRWARLNRILRGETGPGDAAAAAARELGLDGASAKRTEERLTELERSARRDVYRLGFLRYNSFSDVGSDLSFAVAWLNAEGDGIVVTSIYSREETRTYGKAVRKFVPLQEASKEEQQAIAMARTGMPV